MPHDEDLRGLGAETPDSSDTKTSRNCSGVAADSSCWMVGGREPCVCETETVDEEPEADVNEAFVEEEDTAAIRDGLAGTSSNVTVPIVPDCDESEVNVMDDGGIVRVERSEGVGVAAAAEVDRSNLFRCTKAFHLAITFRAHVLASKIGSILMARSAEIVMRWFLGI